jgi:tRNA(Ile)-lysidine synthase
LLGATRTDLERFVMQQGIRHVEDESNSDIRYARNALRHNVIPALAACFPGFQARVARSAQHAQSAQRLLTELAEQDLAACADGDCIDIERLKCLSIDRIDNMLRHWLARARVRMPSTAWLIEMREQLMNAKDDAQVRVIHADCEIRRYRNQIHLTPRLEGESSDVQPIIFRWQGEGMLHFPSYGGSLHFDSAQHGVDATWLLLQEMQIRYRGGGEKLKPALNRPTRSLKHHYQSLNIPAWERMQLPVITAGGQLLYAAGVGMNWLNLQAADVQAIRLRWEKDII